MRIRVDSVVDGELLARDFVDSKVGWRTSSRWEYFDGAVEASVNSALCGLFCGQDRTIQKGVSAEPSTRA